MKDRVKDPDDFLSVGASALVDFCSIRDHWLESWGVLPHSRWGLLSGSALDLEY